MIGGWVASRSRSPPVASVASSARYLTSGGTRADPARFPGVQQQQPGGFDVFDARIEVAADERRVYGPTQSIALPSWMASIWSWTVGWR